MEGVKKENQVEEIELDLSIEEYKQILSDKQIELNKVTEEKNSLISRSLVVHQENEMYKASPQLAQQKAEMNFQLQLAEKFIQSGAFKAKNAFQAYVMIKAGAEMGMTPIESMQSLYCVQGTINFYGSGMVARITKAGYRIEYLHEESSQVTVKVTNKDGFEAIEVVTDKDQIIVKSNAKAFAKKNKMRFHGVRMIASFHLPHLFGSVADEFTKDFHEWEAVEENTQTKLPQGNADLLQQIKTSNTLEQLADLQRENVQITKEIGLISALGARKKFLESNKKDL